MKVKSFLFYALLVFITMVALSFFEKNQMQSGDCTSPYLSGAANWSFSKGWQVDVDEMQYFNTLEKHEKVDYRFKESNNTISYHYNAIGLMYVDLVARTIFFWQGDLQSLVTLQQLFHIIFSFIVLILLPSLWQKISFFLLYTINPLILYLVDFPYYYFWQVIPTAILLIYLLRDKKINNGIFLLSILFSLIVIIRPSTLFIILFVLFFIAYKERLLLKGFLSIALFLGLTFILKPDSVNQPWHTMYIGVGAYPNEYNITLSDSDGFKRFEEERGGKILGCSTNITNNELYEVYIGDFIKNKYFMILQESPELIVKNAFLNIFQSYGLGHKANNYIVNYISVFIGFLLIVFLLYFKEYILFLAIGIASISFSPYYPPIAAYMFGSYILIIYAWIIIFNHLIKRKHYRDSC
ncbi:MAG TPA: hypothetical protein ENK66_00930 [Arcobacter sp.]|nr:hypothetical protein [Arcobacter sp.]